jgi:hypothetical protein
MLTERDRQAAHRSAAQWLQHSDDANPLEIASHYEWAGDPQAAAPWLCEAARRAWTTGAVEQSLALCDRALASGLPRDLDEDIRSLRASVLGGLSRWAEVDPIACELMASSEPGTYAWMNAAALRLFASQRGDLSAVRAVLEGISSMRQQPAASSAWGLVGFSLCYTLDELGQYDTANAIERRVHATPVTPSDDPAFVGYKHLVDCQASALREDDPAVCLRWSQRALQVFVEAGHLTGALAVRAAYLPALLMVVGRAAEGERVAREAALVAARAGYAYIQDWATVRWAFAAAACGDRQAAARAREELCNKDNLVLAPLLTLVPLHGELLREDVDRAAVEAEARALRSLTTSLPRVAGMLEASLALADAVGERWPEALERAEAALASPRLRLTLASTMLYLAHAAALRGVGRIDEARAAAQAACARLEAQAASFDEPQERETYLAQPLAVRTFGLARLLQG